MRAKLAGDDLLVIGSRFAEGSTLTGLTRPRKLVSKVGNQLIRRLSHEDLPADATTSFRVFDPELARHFLRHGLVAGCTGYNFFSLFVLFRGDHRSVSRGADPLPAPPRRQLEAHRCSSAGSSLAACLTSAVGPSQWERVSADEPFGDATDIGCLDELANMPNYQRWIVEEMEPWLRGSVLEVGAGIGTMTPYLAAAPGVTAVCALEPNADAYGRLAGVCTGSSGDARSPPSRLGDRRFDTVVYINCLEHILDEEGELQRVREHLAGPDAHLIIFSPALREARTCLPDPSTGDRRAVDAGGTRSGSPIGGSWWRFTKRSSLPASGQPPPGSRTTMTHVVDHVLPLVGPFNHT